MATLFKRTLKATDEFLGQIRRLSSASTVQAQRVQALEEHLEKLALSTAAASEICGAINEANFLSAASKEKLLQKIADGPIGCENGLDDADGEPCKNSKRVSLQDYTNLVYFIPQDVWDVLMDDRRPTADCVLWLCNHCHKLGLVHPSERTFGVITRLAFWNVWRHGDVPLHGKFQSLQLAKPFIKQYLQHFEKQAPAPQCRQLHKLPKSVANLSANMQKEFVKRPPVEPDESLLLASSSMAVRVTNSSAGISATGAAAVLQMDLKKALSQASDGLKIKCGELALGTDVLPIGNESAEEKEKSTPLPIGNEPAEEKEKSKPLPKLAEGEGAKKEFLNVQSAVDTLKKPPWPKGPHGKMDVQSVLDSLKQKMEAKKGVACESGGDSNTQPRSKKGKDSNTQPRSKQGKKSNPEKNNGSKMKEHGSKNGNKSSATKPIAPKPKRKAKEVSEHDNVSECPWPDWAACKTALLAQFPDDTCKRYTSRLYHQVLQFELKRGCSKDESKERARLRHREAIDQWECLFPCS